MRSLVYTDIRTEIREAFKSSPVFKDFNYDASGVSALIDALAKNAHKTGYMAKMLLDESFRDTAHTIAALTSHAKQLGVELRGKTPATALLVVRAEIPAGYAYQDFTVFEGQRFSAANTSQDTRVFTALSTHSLSKPVSANGKQYFEGEVLVYEGTVVTREFTSPPGTNVQQHIITDLGCVDTTIVVKTRPAGSTVPRVVLPRARGASDVRADMVWFSGLESRQRRTIRLSAMAPLQDLEVTWLSCHGSQGNGARVFTYTRAASRGATDLANAQSVVVSTQEPSQGGGDAYTIDEMREAIVLQYRRQGRVQTPEDVVAFIKETTGDYAAVQAWGGEHHERRLYGRTVICVVPKSSRVLSRAEKQALTAELDKAGMPGNSVAFVDARCFDLRVVMTIVVKPGYSKQSVANEVKTMLDAYFGPTRSRLDVSGQAIREATRHEGVESVGVAFTITAYLESPGSVDFGIPVQIVSAPENAVKASRSRVESPRGTIVVAPDVADFTSPRQSFYSLVESRVEAV